MKTEEIIQRVQSMYSRGAASDNSRLSNRLIYNKLLSARSRLVRQRLNKKQKISQWNYQTLPCIEMVEAEKHECPCLPPVGCTWLKSKYPLPKVFTNLSNHIIEYVTSVDGAVDFSESTWIKVRNKKGNKYTASKPDYFIKDNYLFVSHSTGPKVLTLSALFHNPLNAEYFPSYCDKDCNDPDVVDYVSSLFDPVDCEDCDLNLPDDIDCSQDCESPVDKDFPIDDDDIDTLVEMANNELVAHFSTRPEDLTNDAKDTSQNVQSS